MRPSRSLQQSCRHNHHRITRSHVLCSLLLCAHALNSATEWHIPKQTLRHLHNQDEAAHAAIQPNLLGKACPEGCSTHGVCNPEIGECLCPRHRIGPACDLVVPNISDTCRAWGYKSITLCMEESPFLCLNACNQRGKCIAGFCHCLAGFYGVDCALSLQTDSHKPILLQGLNYSVRASGPKVYVYELPGNFNMHKNLQRIDRPLYLLLMQRLLGSGVRVADGEEADYFFIPVKLRMYESGELLTAAINYIRQRWPYWDSWDGGHRHLVMHTGDLGRGEVSMEARQKTANVTFLTHWGLYADQVNGGWPKVHRPDKDVVVPIFLQPMLVESYGMHVSPLHPMLNKTRSENLTFFFAGRICHNRQQPLVGSYPNCDLGTTYAGKGYSAGTRQKVHYYHSNRTGYKIATSTKSYAQDMASARFCLAPTGAGHGKRNVLVSVLGCIPVTITDFVYQPFEPELDWSDFSVHVPEAEIPNLEQILNVTTRKYQQLQEGLRCGAQHLFWSSIYGSVLGEDGRFDAFETLMAILKARIAHPDIASKDLAAADPELRAFMKCQIPSTDTKTPRHLCTYTPGDTGAPSCRSGRTQRSALLFPGGAMCKNAPNLARCPRPWP